MKKETAVQGRMLASSFLPMQNQMWDEDIWIQPVFQVSLSASQTTFPSSP